MTVADRMPAAVEDATDPRWVAERVSALLAEIDSSADPRFAARAEDLVSLLMRFYGAGLRRILEIADEAGLLDGRLLDDLVRDDLVNSMLVIHDLHPLDLETRIGDALDRVRPYLGSHGGDVAIVGIEGDVVRLRMAGSCSSCPSSQVTLNYAIEEAILAAAPEISRVIADEVEVEATATPQLIQLEPRRGAMGGPAAAAAPTRAAATRTEWLVVDGEAALGATGLGALDVGGMHLVLCRAGSDLYAYRDRCPNCRSALGSGRLGGDRLTCPTCGHTFDVRLAGRSVDGSALHLEPLPLLVDGGTVRIAVPAGPPEVAGVGAG